MGVPQPLVRRRGGLIVGAGAKFRAEVEAAVASRSTVEGVQRRDFRFGGRFLWTVERAGMRNRKKVVRACADVVLAAPCLLANRKDHPLRSNSCGGAPARIRPVDGAVARRCSVESGVAAAHRLHYWFKVGGTVEFASVNVHEDMSIPG